MKIVQRIVISLIIQSDLGILLLLRGLPYAEFRDGPADAQSGVGIWELPGGGLQFGETPSGAGIREASEETGLLLDERDLKLRACCAYTLENVWCHSNRVHVIYDVQLTMPFRIKHSEEHIAHRWLRDTEQIRRLPMIPEIRDVILSSLNME